MAEDFAAIAAEADAEIRANGFACTLWKRTGGPTTPWDTTTETVALFEIWVISKVKIMRDKQGYLTGQTLRTLTTGALGPVPENGDRVAVGKALALADVDDAAQWSEILSPRTIEPGGVPVLYKIDLIQ